jgi:hypothetical protein
VSGKPFFRIQSPPAWTTLALTIRADGSSYHELKGASSFPRHWVYDRNGELVEKAGTIDFKAWYREADAGRTPLGSREPGRVRDPGRHRPRAPALPGAHGSRSRFRATTARADETLVHQGDAAGDELFLLLDGVLVAEIDGDEVAEIGPGAILGELALLDGGRRTATLTARTPCRVVVLPAELIDRQELEDLAAERRW